jgi:hypothetical protein
MKNVIEKIQWFLEQKIKKFRTLMRNRTEHFSDTKRFFETPIRILYKYCVRASHIVHTKAIHTKEEIKI